MKHQKHTPWSATAAIAAALALSASPLAAQDAAAPAIAPPASQAEPAPAQPVAPAPIVAASPAPVVVIPDAAVPAATGAAASEPVAEPSPTMTTTTTTRTITAAPAAAKATRTMVTRTAAPAAPAPVAAVSPPASDVAPPPAETIEAAPIAADLAPPAQPTPAQTENVIGTLGLILLGLVALAIFAAGVLFFRRRSPVMAEPIEHPLVTRPVAEAPIAEPAVAEAPMAAPTMLHRRGPDPVSGALPSDRAAVDLPATVPDSYEERSALLERMVSARPDRANPFTDRKARLHRARLIMQSLGTTFDREPRIDLSQYPDNWPELRRQYHRAA